MPIEQLHQLVLSKSHDLLQADSDSKIIVNSAFQSVTSERCINWINHCVYEKITSIIYY